MKKYLKTLGFIPVIIIILVYIHNVMQFKYGDGVYSIKKFYELESNSVDWIILGSSHAFENINTQVLYDNYGIAAFDLCGSVQPVWNTYYFCKEALNSQRPSLVIFDAYSLTKRDDFADNSRIIKNTFGIKFNRNRFEAIKTSAPKEEWISYIMDYYQFHSRYAELQKGDFVENQGKGVFKNWKGFVDNTSVVAFSKPSIVITDKVSKLTEKNEKWFRNLLELLKEEKIPVYVIVSPYAEITQEDCEIFNEVKNITNEYDIPFTNFNYLYEEIDMDFELDCADGNHLNYIGNRKFTNQLVAYANSFYPEIILDRRNCPGYESWKEDSDYIKHAINNMHFSYGNITNTNDLIEYISEGNYSVIMTLTNIDESEKYVFSLLERNGYMICDNISSGFWIINSEEKKVELLSSKKDIYGKIGERFYYKVSFGSGLDIDIECEGKEQSLVDNGMNFVVIDNYDECIRYSIGFDSNCGYLPVLM